MPQLSLPSNRAEHKLFGLDHLRALAILLVFLYHYGRQFEHPGWVYRLGKFGWTGVDLFFVLSGYLIASQLFSRIARGRGVDLKEFFLKRVFRIIPAYLLIVGVYFLIPAFREREALPPLWKFLSFTQNFGVHPSKFGTFSHAWSLCIEEQFYLLLPLTLAGLLFYKKFNKGGYILLGLFLAGFAIRFASWDYFVAPKLHTAGFGLAWYRWIYYPTFTRLDGLLVGVSLAAALQFVPKFKSRVKGHGNLWLGLSLVVLALAYIVCADEQSFGHSLIGFPLVALGYGVLVLGAVSPSSFLFRFQSRITETIAMLSYAIYLSHKGIIHLTQEYGGKLGMAADSTLMFVLCAATTVTGAFVINRLVEKPFLRLRDHVLQPRKKLAESQMGRFAVPEGMSEPFSLSPFGSSFQPVNLDAEKKPE